MAKRKSTRGNASKPKIIEIGGHNLTEAMHADYQEILARRKGEFLLGPANTSYSRVLELALDEFLAGYRPSKKIRAQLPRLYDRLMGLTLAVDQMKNYPFFVSSGAPRKIGCKALNGLALDLQYASATLAALADAIEVEDSTKVQDWLERAGSVERLGNTRAFAHGNEEATPNG
jgi:hypothetical protein